MLALLSYVAENERINIRQRQAEGIAAAKARGVRFGRPRKKLPEDFDRIVELWEQKKLPLAEAASLCSMSAATFYKKLREYEAIHGAGLMNANL